MRAALIVFLLAVPVYGQRQINVCSITTSVWNQRERIGTSNENLAMFKTSTNDDATSRSFQHPKLPLKINAGVEYLESPANRSDKPERIIIAISISDTEQNAFDAVDNAVAGTIYRHNWAGLYVEKRVVIGELEHSFTLSCSPARTRKKWKR
jgi:hypothetical protein